MSMLEALTAALPGDHINLGVENRARTGALHMR